MSVAIPVRPRIAEHALVRRHVVDGEVVVVIHHAATGALVRLTPRQWDLVAGADGTRDLGGVSLAASRAGAYRRESEVASVLADLAAAGLVTDGIALPGVAVRPAGDRPLDVLTFGGAPYVLRCDGDGMCCSTYSSVVLGPDDAARARSVCPDATPDATPAFGVAAGAVAVAMIDGRCAYLDGAGRCRIHAAGGAAAKPRACRVYPATFVDDGEAIRVSILAECPCVLASAGAVDGAPLVPAGATRASDLEPGVHVPVVPPRLAASSSLEATRAELVIWSRAALAAPASDAVATFWGLARAIDAPDGAVALAEGVGSPVAPTATELAPWIDALRRRARARLDAAAAWRSERDRSRVASAWLVAAADRLADPATLAQALSGAEAPADEALYLRAAIHGHHLVGAAPLATALRDRAVRLLVARAASAVIPDGDAAKAHPIAPMEMLLRGHGVSAYVADRLAGPA